MKHLSVEEFVNMRERGDAYTLLDVRRDNELSQAAYPQPYLHIEMSEVPGRLTEIAKDKPIIVACRSGGRSAKIAELLLQNGYKDVYNLTGGILAWLELADAANGDSTCPT